MLGRGSPRGASERLGRGGFSRRRRNSGRFADPDSVPFLRPDGSTRPKLRLPKVKPWSQGEEANIEVVSDEEEAEVASSSSARAPTLPPKPKIRTAPAKASGAVPADTSSPRASGAVPVKATTSKASGAVPV